MQFDASDDAAHLLGGVMLVLSFALLFQRRAAGAINAYAAQAMALALAAAWQAWVQESAALALTAAITLAKGIVLPVALRRILRRSALPGTATVAPPVMPALALGVGLVVLAATVDARGGLSLALAVVLLGLLVMGTRRDARAQVIGFLSLENGLVLAAVGAAGTPLVAEWVIGLGALAAGMVGALVLRSRDRDTFGTALPDGAGRNRR